MYTSATRDDVQRVFNKRDEYYRKASECKERGDLQGWAIWSMGADAIEYARVILGVLPEDGTG